MKHKVQVRDYHGKSHHVSDDFTVVAEISVVLCSEQIGNFNPLFCTYRGNRRTLVHSDKGDVSDPFRRDDSYLGSLFIALNEERQTDQYGDPIPDDLVVLDREPEEFSEGELAAIDGLQWYEPRKSGHCVLVSWRAFSAVVGGTELASPEDCDVDPEMGFDLINAPLHRYEEGRFYHA